MHRPQSCERACQWASQALDRELSELERAGLQRHVAACPSCAAFAASLRAVTAALRTAPLARPLQLVVVPPVPRRARARRQLAFSRAVLAAVAAAAVAALMAGTLIAYTPSPRLVKSGAFQLSPDNGRAELDRDRLTAAFARIPDDRPWVGHGTVT